MAATFPFGAVIFDGGVLAGERDREPDGEEGDLMAALEVLAAHDVPLAVVSDAPPRRAAALRVAKSAPYFEDRVFDAAMVPRTQPCPDLCLLAAARLGVAPSRCAVVAGSPGGAGAGATAGMSVFGYARDAEPAALNAAGATVFDHMARLPTLLQHAHARPAQADDGARLRDAYGRFFAGDPRGLAAFLADDVIYHLPGRHLGGGTLHGWQEMLERTIAAARSCDAPPTMRLDAVVGTRDVVLSLERITASRRGRALDQEVCVVWRMVDGRCVEVWSRFADQPACDRFWAEP